MRKLKVVLIIIIDV